MWETPLLTGRRLFSLQTRCYVLVHIKPCTPSPLWNRAVAAAGIQRLVKVEGNPGGPSDWVSEGTKNYYSAKATQLCRNGLKTTRGMFSIKSKRAVHTWSPCKNRAKLAFTRVRLMLLLWKNVAILERGEYFCSQLLYMINVILSEINVEVFLFTLTLKRDFFYFLKPNYSDHDSIYKRNTWENILGD